MTAGMIGRWALLSHDVQLPVITLTAKDMGSFFITV
jgi:hypothetical protein